MRSTLSWLVQGVGQPGQQNGMKFGSRGPEEVQEKPRWCEARRAAREGECEFDTPGGHLHGAGSRPGEFGWVQWV